MVPDPNPDDAGDGYSFTYDASETDQPSMGIIEAVAWVRGTDLRDLQPLHDSIDTEDLNRQFGASDRGVFYRSAAEPSLANQRFAFEYEGCTVTVTAAEIRVEER